MSLWRMYSAREQDQPPSVLLVGTFCKNQQGRGPGVGDLMPQVDQATSVPWKAEPSHIHQSFPWRMSPPPPETTKFHFTPLTAPLLYTVSLEPTSCNKRLHSFLPAYFTSASQRKGNHQDASVMLFHKDHQRNHPQALACVPSRRRGTSYCKLGWSKSHAHGATGFIETQGTSENKGWLGRKSFLQKQVCSRSKARL